MLYSTYHKKDTYEDPKTSSIFGNLILLPDDVLWHVLRSACHDIGSLPQSIGLLQDYAFWPHWNPEHTLNNALVEPDVFLRFEKLDVIIEAKVADGAGQYQDQWNNEFTSYLNEYQSNNKDVVILAVGGNSTYKSETAYDLNEKRNVEKTVYRISWMGLRQECEKLKKQAHAQTPALQRLLSTIILAFDVHCVFNVRWFDTLCENKVDVSQTAICNIVEFFKCER